MSFGGHRLALGTAQFGMHYGVANERGQVPQAEVNAILAEASEAGVHVLDTAIAYGEAETVVGRALATVKRPFDVVTKVPKAMPAESVLGAVEASRKRLGVSRLHALLLHHAGDLLEQPSLVDALVSLKERGLVERLGASLYQPSELADLKASGLPLDMVQIPFSAVDQRFAPNLPALAGAGVEVHVRSVFLQGLLLMSPEQVTKRFPGLGSRVVALRDLAASLRVPAAALLLGAAAVRPEIAHIVIGVDSLGNFRENVESLAMAAKVPELADRMSAFSFDDEDVLLPSRWQR